MLRLPPPVWTLIYLLIAASISWWLGWPKIPGLPVVALGIALVVGALILPVWAILLFRRESTEVSPISSSNRTLVAVGPYRLTRNPMYLGLVIWVHIPFEEAKMRRQFRATYDDYVGQVRRWL